MRLTLLTTALILLATASTSAQQTNPSPNPPPMESFTLDSLLHQLNASGGPFLPFLDRPSLRCGIYRLPAGGVDRQDPHRLDEIYYVIQGRARFEAEGQTRDAQPGDVIFVEAQAAHHFYDIESELVLLVVFPK